MSISDRASPTHLRKERAVPEPAASSPDPVITVTQAHSSADDIIPPMPFPSAGRAVPPMPSEVTNEHDRTRRPSAGGLWRGAMMSLRKMTRRSA